MILGWPLTTSTEIAQVLRLGGHLRPDSALRALRDKGVPAEPITVVPRSGRGAHGRVVWYSSLMLDVARLIRVERAEAAAEVHGEATRLAGHRSARFVADWLVEHGKPDPDPALLDASTGGALSRLGLLTASARSRLLPQLGIETFTGRITEVADRSLFVLDDDGHSVPIPAPDENASAWHGAPVSIDIEHLTEGTMTIQVRPAFDPEDDPNQRVSGGPRLLTSPERERIARPVVSTP